MNKVHAKTLSMNTKKYSAVIGALPIGTILGFRTFLGTIALTTLMAQAAQVSLSSLLANVLVGVVISCALVSALSKISQSVSQPQDGPAVILSTVLASSVGMVSDHSISTVMMINGLCCLSAGIFFWVIGRFKFGNAARLLPYPVIGGFLAGSGLLLLIFALQPVTKVFFIADLDAKAELAKSTLATLAFVIFTLQVNRFVRGPIAMPIVALLFAAVINSYASFSGYSHEQLLEYGWFISFVEDQKSVFIFPNDFFNLNTVSAVFAKDWNELIGVAVVSVVSLLLILSSLELTLHREIDINHELKVAGYSNILNALIGGLISYTALSATLLAIDRGDKNKAVGFIVALVCGLLYFGNLNIIEYIPKPVISGILILMGYGLIKDWLLKNYSRLGLFDYFSILIISLSIVNYGYIGGIIIGIIISVFIFVLRYSRINVIKYELTGSDLQSRIVRPTLEEDFIKLNGDKIRIIRLDGFLFFGSVHSITTRITNLIDINKVEFIILDFSLVESLDLAAIETINRSVKYAEQFDCRLFLAGASTDIVKAILKTANFVNQSNFITDVDRALEICEDHLLKTRSQPSLSKEENAWFESEEFLQLRQCSKILNIRSGEYLFKKNDDADILYFLLDGLISINVSDINGNTSRVQTLMKGSLIGERSFITEQKHSADAVAESPATVIALDKTAYLNLKKTNPGTIDKLNYHIIKTLSDRLLSADQLISLLMLY